MLDIKAKSLNVPVYDFLGGAVRTELPLYWSHCGTYRMSEENSKAMGRPHFTKLDDLVELGAEVRESAASNPSTNIFLFDEDPNRHFVCSLRPGSNVRLPGAGGYGHPARPELSRQTRLNSASIFARRFAYPQ